VLIAHDGQVGLKEGVIYSWTSLIAGHVKVNIDASCKEDDVGYGMIARDEEGEVLAVATKVNYQTSDVILAEAEALRWSFEMARDLCFTHVEFETDNLALV